MATSAWDATPAPGARVAAMPAASAAGAVGAAPAGSAWDATQVAAPAPSRGVLDQATDLMTALGHHVMKMPHGAALLAENGVAKLFSLTGDNPVSRYVSKTAADDNQALNEWEAAYQKGTPNSGGAYAGATVGEVAPFVFGALPKALDAVGTYVGGKVAGMLPTAAQKVGAKLVSAGTQGAAVGAVQPVDTSTSLGDLVTGAQAPDYWQQVAANMAVGAGLGGAVPIATVPISAAWNAGKRAVAGSQAIIDPAKYAARQLGLQLGADAPTVASDLASAPEYVPGSVPTSAQAGANPRLVQVEKALANQSDGFKAKLAARENANNAARLQAVGNVAQTPDALEAAIAARNARTAPMRDFAVTNGNPVPVGDIQGAISSLEHGPQGVDPTIGNAAGAMGSDLRGFTNVTPANTLTNTPGSVTASPEMLDALRQNANKFLSAHAPQGFVGTPEQAAMMPVKGAIIDAIDAANPRRAPGMGGWGQGLEQAGPTAPGYRDYLAEFAKQSVPINTMQVGQQLQEALSSKALNSSGDAAATLTNYRGALAKALRGSDYGIDPQAQAALEAVQSDLQRATISNSIRAAGGSDTAYNTGAGSTFLKSLGAGDDGNAKAAMVAAATLAATGSAKTAGAAAFGAKKASGWVTNRVSDALGDLMLDPQKLAQALNAGSQPLAVTAPSAFGRLGNHLPAATRAALISQLLNAQAPQVVGADPKQANAHQY